MDSWDKLGRLDYATRDYVERGHKSLASQLQALSEECKYNVEKERNNINKFVRTNAREIERLGVKFREQGEEIKQLIQACNILRAELKKLKGGKTRVGVGSGASSEFDKSSGAKSGVGNKERSVFSKVQ